jgi:hypothetical protein
MDWVLTLCSVGEYNPVCVESAILISACGRMVRVGLDVSDEDGVMELLKRGHSIIAFDKVLSRMGR